MTANSGTGGFPAPAPPGGGVPGPLPGRRPDADLMQALCAEMCAEMRDAFGRVAARFDHPAAGPGPAVAQPAAPGASAGTAAGMPAGTPGGTPDTPSVGDSVAAGPPAGGGPSAPADRPAISGFADADRVLADMMALLPGHPAAAAPAMTAPPAFPPGTAPPLGVVLPEFAAAPAAVDFGQDYYFLRGPLRPAAPPAPARPAGGFDVEAVRRDFPILSQRVHGRPLVWLDNAATTQKPRAVIDTLARFYAHDYSNVNRAGHALAVRSTEAYEGARDRVRRFIRAAHADEIVFVRGTTEAINLVAQTYGRAHVSAGDEIVLTALEHHSNLVPWQSLCAEKHASLRVLPIDDAGAIQVEELANLLGPRTRLVAVSHVSNVLGTVAPIRRIAEWAHARGVPVLVDGAQAAGHMPIDVQALDCDFYAFSGHKLCGPTGIGVLYGKKHLLEEMPPWQGGGGMIKAVTWERTTAREVPAKFEAGTGSIADAVGLGAAIEYLERIGRAAAVEYERGLMAYATAALAAVPGLRQYGTTPGKVGALAFTLAGIRPEDLAGFLDRQGIAVRAGQHCAQPLLARLGVASLVRPSIAFYNTRAEIDALAAALRQATS